jgi:hypothetical protein
VNYSFEKRKRELDRKSKKEAKAQRKAQEQAAGISHANDGVPDAPLTGPVHGFDTDDSDGDAGGAEADPDTPASDR